MENIEMINSSNLKQFEFSYEELDRIYEEEMKEERGLKAVKKYLEERIFQVSNMDVMYIIENGELAGKTSDVWAKYEKKIKSKDKTLMSVINDAKCLYVADVFVEDFVIDKKNKRINLAPKINFVYNEKKAVDEINGQYIIDEMKRILTSNKDDQWKCLSYFISCALKGQLSQVIVFMQALGGVGKSFFVEKVISKLLGKGMLSVSENTLSGQDMFNSHMTGIRMALLEETSGTASCVYQKVMKTLKETSTSEYFNVRGMRMNSKPIKNMINYMVLSNHFRDLDLTDRRLLVLDISNEKQGNTAYFNDLYSRVNDKSLQYVFNYFYKCDTSNIVLAPETQGKLEFKEANMQSTVRFLIEELMIRNPRDEYHCRIAELYTKYEQWMKAQDKKGALKDLFSNTVRQYVRIALNAEGKEKRSNGASLYDFSYQSLYDAIITRSRVLTPDQFMEKQYEHANKKVEANDVDTDEEKKEMANIIQFLQSENKKQAEEKEILERELYLLKQELENLKKAKEEPKEKVRTVSIIEPENVETKEKKKEKKERPSKILKVRPEMALTLLID